jgi:hypothetical protein
VGGGVLLRAVGNDSALFGIDVDPDAFLSFGAYSSSLTTSAMVGLSAACDRVTEPSQAQ